MSSKYHRRLIWLSLYYTITRTVMSPPPYSKWSHVLGAGFLRWHTVHNTVQYLRFNRLCCMWGVCWIERHQQRCPLFCPDYASWNAWAWAWLWVWPQCHLYTYCSYLYTHTSQINVFLIYDLPVIVWKITASLWKHDTIFFVEIDK